MALILSPECKGEVVVRVLLRVSMPPVYSAAQ